jgi:hypothetical protein
MREGGENAMMDMGNMADRCMSAMSSMMGGGMTGNSIMLLVLIVLLFVWVVGLAAVGALIFWVGRRFVGTHLGNG